MRMCLSIFLDSEYVLNYICFLLLYDKFTKKIICLFPFDTRAALETILESDKYLVGYDNWSFIVVLNIVHLNNKYFRMSSRKQCGFNFSFFLKV